MRVADGIAVVVIARDSEATIDACLQALRVAADVVEIRVIDNDSVDTTVEIVQRHAVQDARIRFVANPDDIGWVAAMHQGVRDSRAAWLAVLDPACWVEPDSLSRLRAHAAQRVDCLFGVDLVDDADVRMPSARTREPVLAFWTWRLSVAQRAVAYDARQTVQPVDAVAPEVMLFTRALFHRIRGGNPELRSQVGALDVCRRIRDAGGCVACANDVRVMRVRDSGAVDGLTPLWQQHRDWFLYTRQRGRERGRKHDHALLRAWLWLRLWLRFPYLLLAVVLRAQWAR